MSYSKGPTAIDQRPVNNDPHRKPRTAARITRKELKQLLVLGLIALGVGQILQRTASVGVDVSSNTTVQTLLKDHSSPSREVEDATLTLVVFTDYQCPACKLADPQMMAAVENDGHIRIVYKDWPIFGAISEQAARIAIASDRQNIYSLVHRKLMNERRTLNEQVIREAVTSSGGSWAQVQRDLLAHSTDIENQLNRNREDAFRLGLAGTPAYLIGSTLVSGGLDEKDFAQAFWQSRKVSN